MPVRRLPALLVPSLCLTLTSAALAGPVTGRLLDPDGRAVPNARVLLVRGASIVTTATTDGRGGFTLDGPDQGRFEVKFAADGLRAEPIAIAGRPGSQDLGSIGLSVSAVAESVVVSAAQTDIPLSATSSTVTVITGEELAARQIESLQDALRLVPGLTVAASGGRGALSSVFPRGGESDYSLVLIDGVQANSFGGGFDFAHVPAVGIDRIEIVRGPQSALYGSNAIGSVIRVIGKRGGPPEGTASFEGGSFGTTRLAAASSGSAGAWAWSASAERLDSDGLNGDRTAAGETIVNDDYSRYSLAGGGGWSHADGTGIHGGVHYLADERGAPGPFGSDPGGFFPGIDAISRGTNERWLASASGATASTRRVRAQAQVTHGRVDGQFVGPFGDSEAWSRRTTARGQADARIGAALDASAGLELQRERAGSTFITASASRAVPVERGVAGLFGELRWNHDSRIYLTAGVRAERITRSALDGNADGFAPRPDFADETIVSVNPKLAASWFVRSRGGAYTKVRVSGGTGIRPPDGFEIAFTDNPALKPERSRSLDAGLDQAFFDGRMLVEATAFFNEYDDLIIAVGSFSHASRYRTDNISNARARGLEIAGSGRVRYAARVPIVLHVRAGYTLLHTQILAVDGDREAPPPFVPGDPLLRRPRHQLSVDLLVEAGRLRAFVQGGARSRVRDVEPSLGTFGGLYDSAGYSVWNAGVSLDLGRAVELVGRVTNVFDRRYEEVLGYPALPRGLFAGLRIAARR